ncbi:MAG: ATP-grasp domain-containing protein [Cyclobacteriaceae bacterium]
MIVRNILVSGASGIVGYGILRSLGKTGGQFRLVGTTIYEDSVAEGFCDVFEKAPLTNDEKYIPWLLTIIGKHKVDLLIPGIEADMYKWVEHVAEIENHGAKVLLNTRELIELCKDKWLFYEKLNSFKTPYAIESLLKPNFDILSDKFGLPFLLKPRRGFGSKGIVRVGDQDEFEKHRDAVGVTLMAQPIVGTDEEEYTTSAFCDGRGGFFAFMTLKRRLSKEGFTEKAEVVDLVGIQEALDVLCEIFKPLGPTNFQFRKHNGILKLLEINPRVSSSTSIRAAFGYNECQMSVDYFIEGKKPTQPLISHGRAVRYIEDFIFFDNPKVV